MRHASFCLPAIILLLAVPLRPVAGGDGGAPEKPSKKEKEAKEAGAKKAEGSDESDKNDKTPSKPLSANLTPPEDISEDAKKALADAIAAYRSAEKATAGREKLLTQAISKLKNVEPKAPKSALPYYYLGIAYQMKRNFPQAKIVLEKAVKLNPTFHEAYVELGDVYVWQKKLKEALPIYDQALSIAPTHADARERKAITLIRMGSFQAARTEAEEALKAQKTGSRAALLFLIDRELKGPGWAHPYTVETDNYKVTTSISEDYAREIANHAELIRRAYNTIFSGIPKPDRKYEIWVYEDMDAYHKAGAPPQVAGHYDTLFRKLVIPRQRTPADTFLVLHHEAFHQYLHDYVELAPQWFNEGLGDYFGAYEYGRRGEKESMLSRPNPWRLRGLKSAIERKILPAASDLMVMSQEEMYAPEMAGYHYAEAWGIMYFIIEGNKPAYKPVLINYFNAIRKGRDRNEAYEQTFGKIDMTKFDAEWKGFISNLAIK